jgi:hypothetical protein
MTRSGRDDVSPMQREVYEVQRKFIAQLSAWVWRMRMLFRVLAAAVILFLLVCFYMKQGLKTGLLYALGAFLGAFIVDLNLSIFQHVVRTSDPEAKAGPIWLTILKFYGLFAMTAVYVFICIFFHLGEPKGFLAGILCFLPALLGVIVWITASWLANRRGRPGKGGLPGSGPA